MINHELSKQLTKLNELFNKVETYNHDIELMSHWARYLCIQSAGFIENSIKELYGEHIKLRSSENVTNFANSKLKRAKSPKAQNILEIAASFNPKWYEALDEFINENGRREAIDALMNDRNHIAHGGSSTITVIRVRGYLDKVVEVMDFIEDQLA